MLTAQEGYKLRVVRDAVFELDRLRESLEELRSQTIGSPKLDGMPHGGSQRDVMADRLIHLQKMEQRVEGAEERLRRLQNAARRIIKDMQTGKLLFYEAYYIEGCKQDAACRIARISESTGYRYMRFAGEQ